MTKKQRLIENLKTTIYLYFEDRKDGKDVKRLEDGITQLLDEFGYQFTSNRIVARLKMRQLSQIYNAKTSDERDEALHSFFKDFFIHFRD